MRLAPLALLILCVSASAEESTEYQQGYQDGVRDGMCAAMTVFVSGAIQLAGSTALPLPDEIVAVCPEAAYWLNEALVGAADPVVRPDPQPTEHCRSLAALIPPLDAEIARLLAMSGFEAEGERGVAVQRRDNVEREMRRHGC